MRPRLNGVWRSVKAHRYITTSISSRKREGDETPRFRRGTQQLAYNSAHEQRGPAQHTGRRNRTSHTSANFVGLSGCFRSEWYSPRCRKDQSGNEFCAKPGHRIGRELQMQSQAALSFHDKSNEQYARSGPYPGRSVRTDVHGTSAILPTKPSRHDSTIRCRSQNEDCPNICRSWKKRA
jgi:hypothetical protein